MTYGFAQISPRDGEVQKLALSIQLQLRTGLLWDLLGCKYAVRSRCCQQQCSVIHTPDFGDASLLKTWVSNYLPKHPAWLKSASWEGGGEGLQLRACRQAIRVQREGFKTQCEKTLQCCVT